MKEIDHFTRICHDTPFRDWLVKEREQVIKFMAGQDGPPMYRAQGMYTLLTSLIENIDKAKTLR